MVECAGELCSMASVFCAPSPAITTTDVTSAGLLRKQTPVSGPAAAVAYGAVGLAEFRNLRSHLWSLRYSSFRCHLILPQMTAGQVHENVFETGLARAEVFELVALLIDRSEQRGNGE